jgi:hypothetical protein
MRDAIRPLLVLVLVLALVALPAAAEPENDGCYQLVEEGVRYCTSEVWFTPAETKVGNLGATGATGFPTWDDTEPSASVTAGAGGGYAANGAFRQLDGTTDPEVVATFVGTHAGPIDNVDVELYLFAPGRQSESTFSASGDLLVDGEPVASFDQTDLPLKPSGSAVLTTGFAFTGVGAAMERRGIDPEAEHDLTVHVTGFAIATTSSVIVYDTTEAPSGMVFNTPGDLRYPAIRAR